MERAYNSPSSLSLTFKQYDDDDDVAADDDEFWILHMQHFIE